MSKTSRKFPKKGPKYDVVFHVGQGPGSLMTDDWWRLTISKTDDRWRFRFLERERVLIMSDSCFIASVQANVRDESEAHFIQCRYHTDILSDQQASAFQNDEARHDIPFDVPPRAASADCCDDSSPSIIVNYPTLQCLYSTLQNN